MSLIEIFTILVLHWVADFVIQTDEQAKGKSSSMLQLVSHTVFYSTIWVFPLIILKFINPEVSKLLVLFPLITFFLHTVTDYFTSRLNKKLWEQGKTHLFFVAIGFDQVLHYLQLFLTYQILK